MTTFAQEPPVADFIPKPTVAEIVREFLDKYDRWLVGTEQEQRLIKQLEAINEDHQ